MSETQKVSLLLVAILLLAIITPVAFTQATTITVPDDFSTIQEAVNAASPGDTIYVRAGTYHETVTINKNSLALTGENKFTTIIDGSGGTDRTVLVNKADNVQISGFTIQNSYDGIYLLESSFSTVSGNIITTCSFRGIILSYSSFITVSGNALTSNNDGIELYRSSFVTVSGNTITNSRFGIGTSESFNNTFSGNTITTCQQGIYMWDCSYTTASGNTISNTTEHGISLVVSAYCSFFANTITISAMRGISICNSTDCVVSGNTIKFTASQGIHTFYSSGHTISDNTLTSNFVGLEFYMSSDSTVFGNTMSQSRTGITVTQASNNIFYHNSIVDNQYQVVVQNSINTWDDGYPSGGNYWSDYKGADANGDGIGDKPYTINENNQDRYPLMEPYNGTITGNRTWTVDDDGPADFSTIQEAINHANNGDTILVNTGTYYEHVVVNKSLSLVGNEGAVIDANEDFTGYLDPNIAKLNAITVVANNSEVSGFVIRNASNCGIEIRADYSKFHNNLVENCNWMGIALYGGERGSQPAYASHDNLIFNNTLLNNHVGVWLSTVDHNKVVFNDIKRSKYSGVYVLSEAYSNTIANNSVSEGCFAHDGSGGWGIAVGSGAHDNHFYGNNISGNLGEGIRIAILGAGVPLPNSNWVYHNTFTNQTANAYDDGINTVWDLGYPSGGNYWSDYNCTDADGDGIGDVPYVIDEDSQDNYPLVPFSTKSVHNLDTGLNYTSIQAAIYAPETLNGHTIFVDSGTYNENVVVTKSVSLIGESSSNTVIDGGGASSPVVFVNHVNDVTISEFTIQNGEKSIYILNSQNTVVTGNTIKDNHGGINVDYSEYSTISGNFITNNTWSGIELRNTVNSFVSENTVADNKFNGIHVFFSENAVVSRNTVINSNRTGISFSCTNNSIASGNLITQSGSIGAGFSSSYNVTISENVITNGYSIGVVASFSSNASISRNTITDMVHHGIYLGGSSNIHVNANNITDCLLPGMKVFESTNNVFTENTVSNVTLCVELNNSSENLFYHNSFISDVSFIVPVRVINCTNTWNNGAEGNYWSNYYGTDADGDGIGDILYTFGETEQDNYPLMTPYGSNISISYTLVVESVPSGVTFTADNVTCVAPWSETYNQTTLVTLTMPESYIYEEKNYTWTRWDDGNTNRTRTVTVDKYTELTAIFTIEYEPPEIVVLSPENKTYSVTDVPLEYTVNIPFYVTTYSLDGQPFVDAENVTALSGLADGTHELTVIANFTDSDVGESTTVWFTVDTVPPTIANVTLLPLTVNGSLEDGAKVNATVTDTVSGVNQVTLSYTTDNETWVTTEMAKLEANIWNGTIPGFPHDTNVTYIIVAEDMAGNPITSEELLGQPNQYQVLPEVISWIILPMLLSVALLGTVYKKKLHRTPNQQSY